MTFRALAFAVTTAALVASGTAHAAAQSRGTLTCDELYQGRRFELHLDPPRYVRTTELDMTSPSDELMRAFQEPGEEQLTIRDSALHIALNPGSCTLDTANRAHFLECPHAADDKLALTMTTLQFTAEGTSRLGARQSTTIRRDLRIVSVDVHAEVQRKNTSLGMQDRVIADLTIVAAVGAQSRTLHLTKDLGEWTQKKDRSDNDRCVVAP